MIVVDTNVIVYLYMAGPFTGAAQQALAKDSRWVAPHLWRSQVRSVLARCVTQKQLRLGVAQKIMQAAEVQLQQNEFEVNSEQVLKLATSSGCTAYDCEFVALAINFNIPLITMDKQVLRSFPNVARPLTHFAAT